MLSEDQLCLTGGIAVCAYYLFVWLLFRRARTLETVITLYDPPRDLSPAMLRYIWKERFDDRTFWAGVLSLVAKGLATLHSDGDSALIRATPTSDTPAALPKEEEILLRELVRGHMRKGVSLNMLSTKAALAVRDMAESLRRDAVGRWFTENRPFVIAGIFLSATALVLVANPHNKEQWGALVLALAVMAPGAFYLFFISQRLCDVLKAARQKLDWAVLSRETLLLIMILPCVAALILGGVVAGGTFGWQLVATTLFLAILNACALGIKTPTTEGKKVLTEIAGFRLFLKSVERLPMQRNDEPADHAGVYEKYLPYAIALEVEQAWGDRLLALTSTYHQNAGMQGAEAFYLGMWDGKPLEIVYKPEAPKSRSF